MEAERDHSCPICGRMFTRQAIEQHVDNCLDGRPDAEEVVVESPELLLQQRLEELLHTRLETIATSPKAEGKLFLRFPQTEGCTCGGQCYNASQQTFDVLFEGIRRKTRRSAPVVAFPVRCSFYGPTPITIRPIKDIACCWKRMLPAVSVPISAAVAGKKKHVDPVEENDEDRTTESPLAAVRRRLALPPSLSLRRFARQDSRQQQAAPPSLVLCGRFKSLTALLTSESAEHLPFLGKLKELLQDESLFMDHALDLSPAETTSEPPVVDLFAPHKAVIDCLQETPDSSVWVQHTVRTNSAHCHIELCYVNIKTDILEQGINHPWIVDCALLDERDIFQGLCRALECDSVPLPLLNRCPPPLELNVLDACVLRGNTTGAVQLGIYCHMPMDTESPVMERTPIHCAVLSESENIKPETFAIRNEDLTKTDVLGRTPLALACLYGKGDKISPALFEALRVPDVFGNTPVFLAVLSGGGDALRCCWEGWRTHGSAEELKMFVNKGNCFGETALMLACALGNIEVVKKLLELGSSIQARSFAGVTAIHLAATRGHASVLEYLLHNVPEVPVYAPFAVDLGSDGRGGVMVPRDHILRPLDCSGRTPLAAVQAILVELKLLSLDSRVRFGLGLSCLAKRQAHRTAEAIAALKECRAVLERLTPAARPVAGVAGLVVGQFVVECENEVYVYSDEDGEPEAE